MSENTCKIINHHGRKREFAAGWEYNNSVLSGVITTLETMSLFRHYLHLTLNNLSWIFCPWRQKEFKKNIWRKANTFTVMFHMKLMLFWSEYFMSREKKRSKALKNTVNMFWKIHRNINVGVFCFNVNAVVKNNQLWNQ